MTTDQYVPLTGPPTWPDVPCRLEDPELFFPLFTPQANRRGETAFDICRRCSHTDDCIQYAHTLGARDGIWGGYHLTGKPVRDCALSGCDRPNIRQRSAYCSSRCSDTARYQRKRQEAMV